MSLRVLLVRDIPEERRHSMERFADELQANLGVHSSIEVEAMALHESQLAGRLGIRRLDSYVVRFAGYPLAARRRHGDVYHVIDHGYAHAAALLPPERVVVTCHDLMLLRAAEGRAGFDPGRLSVLRFRWSTSYLRRVAHVVCDSESTREDVVRLRGVSPERTSVVPLGIGRAFRPLDEARRARVRDDLGIGARCLIAHVSTGHEYKNTAGTLRVIAALRDAGVDVGLLRIGRPLSKCDRAVMRALRLEGRVLEQGSVDDARLAELYAAADVLLFPSYHEGFGWPPLEAMACGTPVVVSDCAPLRAIVGDAGLYAPAGDVRGLMHAARDILESPGLTEQMRAHGAERAAAFTWERTAQAYAAVYERVAAGSFEAALAEVA